MSKFINYGCNLIQLIQFVCRRRNCQSISRRHRLWRKNFAWTNWEIISFWIASLIQSSFTHSLMFQHKLISKNHFHFALFITKKWWCCFRRFGFNHCPFLDVNMVNDKCSLLKKTSACFDLFEAGVCVCLCLSGYFLWCVPHVVYSSTDSACLKE